MAPHAPSSPNATRLWAVLALCAALQACGGGGGGVADGASLAPAPAPTPVVQPPAPAPAPVDADVQAASKAALRILYRPASQDVELAFTDVFFAQTSYRIDRLVNGVWITAITQPASQTDRRWVDSIAPADAYRVIALRTGKDVPLQTADGKIQVETRTDLATMTVQADKAEPLSGTVNFSASGAPAGSAISWAVMTSGAPSSDIIIKTGGGSSFAVDASQLADAKYGLRAIVQASAGSWVQIRKDFSFDDEHFSLSLVNVKNEQTTDVVVKAASDRGISSVTLFVDGKASGTLSAKNYCYATGSECGNTFETPNSYRFVLDNHVIGFGKHDLRAVVDVANGQSSGEVTGSIDVNSAPLLVLNSPQVLDIVSGTLRVTGTLSDDSEPVEMTARLDGTVVGSSNGGAFDFKYDLSGTSIGLHTLEVVSRDRLGLTSTTTRRVLVQPVRGLTFERVAEGARATRAIISVNGPVSLVQRSYGEDVYAMGFGPQGQNVVLQQAGIGLGAQTLVGDKAIGLTYRNRPAGDLTLLPTVWGRDGVPQDLSQGSGLTTGGGLMGSGGRWVTWNYQNSQGLDGGIVLRHLDTGEQHLIKRPASYTANGFGTALVVPKGSGAVVVFGYMQVAGAFVSVYDSTTDLTMPFASTTALGISTDGNRLLWRDGVNSSSSGNVQQPLKALTLNAGATPQTLSSSSLTIYSRDGLVAWNEPVPEGTLLKVNDGMTTTTIAQGLGLNVLAIGGGSVAFMQDGKLMVWSAAAGARPVFDGQPQQVELTAGWVYFIVPTVADIFLFDVPTLIYRLKL